MTTDWSALRQAATEVAQNAYAPYSGLRVGAAGLTDSGQLVTGCNVENASYGLTLCAECGLISALHAQQAPAPTQAAPARHAPKPQPALTAVAVVAGDGAPLVPCGRCRQLLLEAGGPDLEIDTAAGPVTIAAMLPGAFTTDDLEARREAR